MTTLESLLNEIVQEVARTLIPLEKRSRELLDLVNEALKNGSIEEQNAAGAKHEEAYKTFREAGKNCMIGISEKYSSKLIDAVKLANSEGSDTNPAYLGEVEEYKGHSLLNLVAYGFFADVVHEILPYLKPEDIKRGAGFKRESELMAAIEDEKIELRDWLLGNDTDLMYQKASGSSALHIACMIKDYATTERLIKRVAEEKGGEAVKEFVNAVNTYGCTPLYDALAMGSSRGTLDNDKMMKFLSLFIENGVELGRENSGNDTGKYTIFDRIVTSHLLEELGLDRASAVVKMLSTGQNITIDLKNPGIQKFFTNETNIQKIFASEDYDAAQKSLALNKIKKALIDFSNQNHTVAESKLEDTINLIGQQISKLTDDLTESDIATSEVASGIKHIDIDSNTPVEISGHSDDAEFTEV